MMLQYDAITATSPATSAMCVRSEGNHAVKVTTTHSFVFSVSGAANGPTTWISDSGASSHMSHDRRDFEDFRIIDQGLDVVVANGERLKRLPYTAKWKDDGDHRSNVVPQLDRKLLSVPALIAKDVEVGFEKDGCVIKYDGLLVSRGTRAGKLYVLESQGTPPQGNSALFVDTTDAQTWHARPGHVSHTRVSGLQDTASDAPSNQGKASNLGYGCAFGKMHASGFKHAWGSVVKPHQVVHMDVIGPMETISKGGVNLWYLDTGANVHIVGLKEYFIKFHPFSEHPPEQRIRGVSKQFATHSAGARWNLFSPGKARDQGFTLEYDNTTGHYEIIDQDHVGITAYPENGLWPFHACPTSCTQTAMSAIMSTSLQASRRLEEWHSTFGNINTRYLSQMESEHRVRGQRCKKYRHNNYRRANKPNDLVYADLMTIKGNNTSRLKYILVIVDSYSTFVSFFFSDDKTETNARMQEYIAWAERQQDRKVKRVLTDTGGELVNLEMASWYQQHGIVHIQCGPDAPQFNPTERMNQTLGHMMRAMMAHSGFPPILWTEAALHSAYLRNRYQEKPSVRHLRPFGTLGYAFIAKQHRTKLEKSSVKCYLVGFSDSSTGYKMYFRKQNKIRFVPDVHFCSTVLYKDKVQTNDSGDSISITSDRPDSWYNHRDQSE
ncbi:TPA: hypothetical protein N0F65_000880 [Lagenidium giganteum]|uniref:Integrase catalytic domain-containing protein n=1 Tax=Lagenidium giganteum TaxID=4803 RepID=A0AAV2Z2V9_9STRA|nr:TPA: hypothetical protein N0F65_000880 [Lagenidium giganteum]